MPQKKETNSALVNVPNSIEAEQSVLCCILTNPSVQLDIISALRPSDFYQTNHAIIFEAMERISAQTFTDSAGNMVPCVVNWATLVDKLRRDGKLAPVGDVDYLTFLQDMLPSSARYKDYVSIVKRCSVLRQMIDICGDVIKMCNNSDNSQEVITYAEEKIFKLSQGDVARDLSDLSVTVAHTMKKINDRFVNPGSFHGIDTGYYQLDKLTNGLHGGELVVLAARPGCGKSAMAMNIVEHVAKKGHTVAIFSLEMSNEQLVERMLSSMSGIPLADIRSGYLRGGEADIVKLHTAQNVLCNMKLFGNDFASIRPAEIASQCRRLKAQHGLDMVVIDYLQLMSDDRNDKRNESRQNEVANITRALKIMAKNLDVPVLALSQLKRDAETRNVQAKASGQGQSTPPVLSDLRESGAIEQDADIVLFIHRDGDDNSPDVKLIVAKNRSGSMGDINLKWIGSLVRFVNPSDIESALQPIGVPAENVPDEIGDESVIATEELDEQQAFVDNSNDGE